MIRINRSNCPASLDKPEAEFRSDDCNQLDVKQALNQMQHGKCCYCERDLSELSDTEREVEHYNPKSMFKDQSGMPQWHLANRWSNLLLSCRACNSHKGFKKPLNQIANQIEIIDPSCRAIDPEDHIDFIIDFPVISYKAKNGSSLGDSTIKALSFGDRKDLLTKFMKMKLEIDRHITNMLVDIVHDTGRIDDSKAQLLTIMSARTPHAAFSRNFIAKRLSILNDQELPILERKLGRQFPKISIRILRGSEAAN